LAHSESSASEPILTVPPLRQRWTSVGIETRLSCSGVATWQIVKAAKAARVVVRVDRVAVKAEAGRADRVVARVDQVVGARVARVVARGAPGEARVEAGKTADCPTHEPQ
jgi:hypothetical protein